jgi:uncharacterized protein
MSQESSALVQRALDAYRRRDVQGICDVSHEDCELFTLTEGVTEARPFRGHAGIADWLERELEPWEEFALEPTEMREVGDRVLVRAKVTARGKGSSVTLTADSGFVFDFREGKLFRLRSYLDWREALEAVGLGE